MELLRSVGLFVQNQVLGMKWLSDILGRGLGALGLEPASRWGGSIHFFLYDVIKILVLLGVLIFFISFIQSYFPPPGRGASWAGSEASAQTASPPFWVR